MAGRQWRLPEKIAQRGAQAILADGTHSAGSCGRAGKLTTDQTVLRGLFDRLRDHVAGAEDQASAAFDELPAALDGAEDSAAVRTRAEPLLAAPRSAVEELERLKGEVAVMRGRLERSRDPTATSRLTAFRDLEAELADRSALLASRLVEAEAAVEQALAGLAMRLGRWDLAATEQARRLGQVIENGLAAEDSRTADVLRLLKAIEQRLSTSAPQARPESAAVPKTVSPDRRRGVRAAALLTSAGVACMGLAALVAVLESPIILRRPAPDGPRAEMSDLAVRGRILIAPPRAAELDEFVPPEAPGGTKVEPSERRTLAEAMAAADAGRLGPLRALAEAGQSRAQMYLAKLYEQGRGVAADSGEARRWTAQAAEGGDPVAMHNLALYYLEGRGGPRDDAAAARLLRRAALAGIADSQFNLALLYETGTGVDRNLVEAYRWFQIAAGNGDLKARERAVALEARLSSQELASADRRVARFRPGAGDDSEDVVLIPGTVTVAEAQKKLARLGLYIGPTDGRDTPAYRQAVEIYRESQRTEASGAGAPGDR